MESAKNTPSSSPAKKEKPTKPNVTRAKADKARSGAKRRRTSSDVAGLGWGYLSDDVDVEYSEAGTPSKESKIKNEPVDDTMLIDEPEDDIKLNDELEAESQLKMGAEFE